MGSEESGRVAAVCVPIEPWRMERNPDPGEAVTVSTGGPSWWSGPGEETAFNAARDPGSDNGQRTEAARLSLLSAIPGAVGSCDETDKPAVHCSRPTLVNSRINRAIIKQRKWNIFKTVND